MTDHFLAHLNLVRPTGAISPETPEVQYFFRQLMVIFEEAKDVDGLRWHNHGARMPDGRYLNMEEFTSLVTERGKDNPHVITMAGWDNPRALHRFAYRLSSHMQGMKTLRSWVDRTDGAIMVMWWVPKGERVTIEQGWNKLMHLREHGATPEAFTLQERFEAPVS